MAKIQQGLLKIAGNFQIKNSAPIDDRTVVQYLTDLTSVLTFKAQDNNVYTYLGMFVIVCQDTTPSNNGLYILLGGSDYTNINNWVKIGSSPSGSVSVLPAITQNLDQLNNVIALGGNYDVVNVTVFDSGGNFAPVELRIINASNIEVILGGGEILNATINVFYRVP